MIFTVTHLNSNSCPSIRITQFLVHTTLKRTILRIIKLTVEALCCTLLADGHVCIYGSECVEYVNVEAVIGRLFQSMDRLKVVLP